MGLKQEMAAYELQRRDLELDHFGKWVVFHGGKLVNTYEEFEDAADDAVQRFGRGPYLIRQVGEGHLVLPPSVSPMLQHAEDCARCCAAKDAEIPAELKQEMEAYELQRRDLELGHFGKWVVFHGGKLVNVYDDSEAACDEALQRFGRGPYLIRQIGEFPMRLPSSLQFRLVENVGA